MRFLRFLQITFASLCVGLTSLPAHAGNCGSYTCDIIITIDTSGHASVNSTNYGHGNGEDPAVLVINNSSTPLTHLTLGGDPTNGAFYNDGDGLYRVRGLPNTYETAAATFTMGSSPSTNSGTVTFTTPLVNGGSAYFSLESLYGSFYVASLTSTDPGLPLNYSYSPGGGGGGSSIPNIVTSGNSGLNVTSNVSISVNPVFDGGTLTLGAGTPATTNYTVTANGGTIDINGQTGNAAKFASISDDPSVGINGPFGTLTITNGASSGSPNVLTFVGNMGYSGQTVINNSAILALANDPTNGTDGDISSSSKIVANGKFDISQIVSSSSQIQWLSGSGTVNLGNKELQIIGAASTSSDTFSGTIADGGLAGGSGGSLTILGGTQILSGHNTYTGATTIDGSTIASTLALRGAGSIAQSSQVSVVNGGVFDISGTTSGASIRSLSGDSTSSVNLGNQKLNITNGAGSFAGNIADGGLVNATGGPFKSPVEFKHFQVLIHIPVEQRLMLEQNSALTQALLWAVVACL